MKRWIHAKSEITNFPEIISILLYPTTDTWVTYTKDYEHEGGGCYYHTKDISDPVVSNFVSLYPDGSLTYLWGGVEKPLNHEWKEVVETDKVCAKSDKKRDIEYKIKSYLAAWAKDGVKNGSPVATYDEFEDELKSEGIKADRDKYDYYISCYNNAIKTKKGVKASKSLEDKVRGVISWNNSYFGYVPFKRGNRYYRSNTVRFDDSMGGTEEISEDKYYKFLDKYNAVFGE